MIHPHDTDRILAVLGEAIDGLRKRGGPILEIANDLALLHGAVSAEADKADPMRHERELRSRLRRGAVINWSKRERIAQDVLNGEMREDD